MAGTVGFAVRKAVTDGLGSYLAALPDFNGDSDPDHEVSVKYAYPFGQQLAECVYTGRSSAQTPPAAMRQGRNFRDETGTFLLVVDVAFLGGDAWDADQRAGAIGALVEGWLADRKSNQLGVPGLQTLTVRSWEAGYWGLDTVTNSQITYTVQWTARLT